MLDNVPLEPRSRAPSQASSTRHSRAGSVAGSGSGGGGGCSAADLESEGHPHAQIGVGGAPVPTGTPKSAPQSELMKALTRALAKHDIDVVAIQARFYAAVKPAMAQVKTALQNCHAALKPKAEQVYAAIPQNLKATASAGLQALPSSRDAARMMRGVSKRGGGARRTLTGAACLVAAVLAVAFVRSLIVERGFGYDFGQCLFKSVGSLDKYSKSADKFSSVSDVLASAPGRLGFLSGDFPTDKDYSHNYTRNYDTLLAPYVTSARSVLEVGVKKGGSIQLWRELFSPYTFIYGIDVDPGVPTFVADAHIKILIMDSRDNTAVHAAFAGLPKFDVIVDDGRHTRGSIMRTFRNLRPHLTDKGVYIIEDWQVDNDPFQSFTVTDTVVQLADSSQVESLLVVCPEESVAPCDTIGGVKHEQQ